MALHGALTLILKIRPQKTDLLRSILLNLNQSIIQKENDLLIPFHKLTSVHFARILILEESKDLQGKIINPSLVLATNYDKPFCDHLDELVEYAGSGLIQIFECCEGFRTGDNLKDFILKNQVKPNAFYSGTPNLSVAQIHRENELYREIESYLDKNIDQQTFTPNHWKEKIKKHIESQKRFSWLDNKEGPSFSSKALNYFFLIPLFVLFLIAIPIYALAVIPIIILEKRDKENKDKVESDNVSNLANQEDKVIQNQMTHLVNIKPGHFRLITLKFVLFFINLLARFWFNKGKLGSIPTIHFARWVIIDEGRRLLFFSNYDGSWESYLGDFIDKASEGLTAVWSNTVGFPKSRALLFAGARNEQKFKVWTRNSQVSTNVWYSAYEFLTVENINNNSKIRSDLIKNLSKNRTEKWLKRL